VDVVAARPSPTLRRRRLANELRELREAAGLTIEEVAKRLEVSDSKISRIETAKVGTTPRDVRDLLDIYRIDGQRRDRLMRIAREARQKSWWHEYGEALDFIGDYIGLEAEATSIRQFEAQFVPGLFQTVEYARAIFRAVRPDLEPEAIEDRVRLRMQRHALITTQDHALEVWAILDETVLRRLVGHQEVMREQLYHLVELAALPRVTIQVVPFSIGAHIGMMGSFTILGFAESGDRDVVYVEGHTAAQLLQGPKELQFHEQAFDRLRAAALDPEASVALITETAKG
jgi:transcriptional regulator with XRE-family HTH domain